MSEEKTDDRELGRNTVVKRTPRAKSVSNGLAEKFGGKWKYDNRGSWWCDDNQRHASRVCNCFPSDDDCNCIPTIWVYGDDKPQRF